MSESSPSKRAGVKPMSLSALSGDFTASADDAMSDASGKPLRTPPPEPVGEDFLASADSGSASGAGGGGQRNYGGQPTAPGQGVWKHPPPTTYGQFPMSGGSGYLPSPGTMSGSHGLTPPMPAGGGGGGGGTPMSNYGGGGGHHHHQHQQHPSAGSMNLPSPSGLSETEYLHTRNLVPHVQQRALVAVMQSLIDDFPSLTPVIRIRCEKAMAFVMAQQQREQQQNQYQHGGGGPQSLGSSHNREGSFNSNSNNNANGGNYHPYAGRNGGGAGSTPPSNCITPPGSCTKSGGAKRTNGGLGGNSSGNRREQQMQQEEQEQCGVHGNMRAAKHLNYNLNSQRWECIPGFHCLVDNTAHLAPRSPIPAPSSGNLFTVSSNSFNGGGGGGGGGGNNNGSRRSSVVSPTPSTGTHASITPLQIPSPSKRDSTLYQQQQQQQHQYQSQQQYSLGDPRRGSTSSHASQPLLGPNSGTPSNSNSPQKLMMGGRSSHGLSGEQQQQQQGGDGGGSPTSPSVDVDRLTSLLDSLK